MQLDMRSFLSRSLFFAGLVLTFLFIAKTAVAEVTVGEKAPEIEMKDTKGDSFSLAEQKGKIVVLEWNNPDCPFVKKHYNSGNMQEVQKQADSMGVTWIIVNSSAPGKQGHLTNTQANTFMQDKGAVADHILLDETGEIGRKYGAKTTPHMYVINSEGIVVYNGAIDSIPSADPADIEDADNYILNALESLTNGEPLEVSQSKPYGCSVKYGNS
jgi:peroxiredoxin